MNTQHLHQRLSPTEYAALVDAAKGRALRLRGEARQVFWSATTRRIQSAVRALVQRGQQAHTPSPEARRCAG